MAIGLVENESLTNDGNFSINILIPTYTSTEAVVDAVQLVLNFIVLIFGVTGNVFIIANVGFNKDLRTVSHTMLAAVAACDCTICLTNIPVNIQSIISKGSWEPFGCAVSPLFVAALPQVSLLYQALISINRYVLIKCSAQKYGKWFSPWKSTIMQVVIWVASFAHVVPLLVEGTKTLYVREHDLCLFDIDPTKSSTEPIIHIIFFLALPFLVSAFGYLMIFIFLRKHARQMNLSRKQRRVRGVAYALVQMFVIYAVAEIPHVMVFVDKYVMYPRLLTNFRQFLWWTNSAIDPFFYCWKIEAYRKPLFSIVRRIGPNRRVRDITNSGTLPNSGPQTRYNRHTTNRCTAPEHAYASENISSIALPDSSVAGIREAPFSDDPLKQQKFWIRGNEDLEVIPSTSSPNVGQVETGFKPEALSLETTC